LIQPGNCALKLPFFHRKRCRNAALVAVDVRNDGYLLAVLQEGGEAPSLSFLTKLPLPESNSGYESDLSAALAPLIEEQGLAHCPATTVLHRPDFNLVLTEAPSGLEGEELRTAMQWRVRDLLDFPPEEAVLDVLPIPNVELPGEGPPLFVVAARQKTVRQRILAGREAGLDLQYVDIPDMAHRNLAHLLPEEAAGICLVVLDAENPLISITKGGELIFSRQLGLDIHAEFAALAGELGVDAEEACRLRIDYGLEGEPAESEGGQLAGPDPEPEPEGEVLEWGELQLEEEPAVEAPDPMKEYLTDFAERVALEVQRSLDFYDSRYRQAAIRTVYLAGEGARVHGLEDYLSSALDLTFHYFNPLDYLAATDDLHEAKDEHASLVQEGLYTIGAGLRLLDSGEG